MLLKRVNMNALSCLDMPLETDPPPLTPATQNMNWPASRFQSAKAQLAQFTQNFQLGQNLLFANPWQRFII